MAQVFFNIIIYRKYIKFQYQMQCDMIVIRLFYGYAVRSILVDGLNVRISIYSYVYKYSIDYTLT